MPPDVREVPTRNNDFQHLEVLKQNRNKRHRYRRFFVEGVEPINQALDHKWDILAFAYPGGAELSGWASEILANSRARIHYRLPRELMAELSDKEDTSELLAVVAMPERGTEAIEVTDDLLVVVFDRPSNYGNLGTIIRSCDSFGVDGLIVTGHSIDIYDRRVIRASVGTFFTLPVIRQESHRDLLPWLYAIHSRHLALNVVGTSVEGEVEVARHDFNRPTVIILGNETLGMSRNYRNLSDTMVRIPLCGAASSLNVACAASIVLYEAAMQRRYSMSTGNQGSGDGV